MRRILLLGRNGQVGWELNRSLLTLGYVTALSRGQADFFQPESLRKVVRESRADIIINAAAYTAVDRAESEEPLAQLVNADAPAVLAEEAKRSNALLVHYSTDYVFDGKNPKPYVESDKPNPINAYGRTKLAGELNIQAIGCRHLILRTSWVYSSRRTNFLKTILRLATQCEHLRVIADQVGAPTSARMIADVTSGILTKTSPVNRLSEHEEGDVYHLTSSNFTSWHGFAQTILDAAKNSRLNDVKLPTLISIPTEEYPLPAPRPKNSRLNCDKLCTHFGVNCTAWEIGVRLCLDELTANDHDQLHLNK